MRRSAYSLHCYTQAEYNAIHAYLQTVSILPVDSHLAQLSGALGRTYGLKLADSIIAATALYTGSTIVTRNTRDFKKVANLEILSI
jgi:toxin FitB